MTEPVLRVAFPQVEEADAGGDLAHAYADMRATLRVPWVMFAARALACFGGYVPAAWAASRDVFGQVGLERAADTIRAAALLDDPPPPGLPDALRDAGATDAEIAAVRDAVRTLHYGNAKYLLLITAWSEALHGRPGGTDPDPGWDAAPLPTGPPAGMPTLHLVHPRDLDPGTLTLLEQVVDGHLHHGPASDFRVLAAWPTSFAVIWRDVLAPVVRTPAYDAKARDLFAAARTTVRGFPTPAGISPQQAATVTGDVERAAAIAMLSMFQRFILDVTIDLARVSQALDGTQAARRNPFPPSTTTT